MVLTGSRLSAGLSSFSTSFWDCLLRPDCENVPIPDCSAFPSSGPVGGVWPGESRNRFPAFHYIRRFIDSDSDFWHSCLLCDDINFSGFSFCRLRWRCPMTAFFLTDGVNGSERSMATFQYYSFGVWSHSSTNRQLLLFVGNHWCHTCTMMVVILINSRLGDILLLYRITLLLISVPLFLGIWFKVSSSA